MSYTVILPDWGGITHLVQVFARDEFVTKVWDHIDWLSKQPEIEWDYDDDNTFPYAKFETFAEVDSFLEKIKAHYPDDLEDTDVTVKGGLSAWQEMVLKAYGVNYH